MDTWQKYLHEARQAKKIKKSNNQQVSDEPYQKAVKKGYVKDRNKYLKGGPVSTSAGGSGYTKKPANSRSKSSPPIGAAIGEEVEPETFEKKAHLDSDFWKENDRLDRKIARRLTKIASDFIDGLNVPVEIEDIRFTGSLANYNWSKYSDVDLHIVVDFNKIDEDAELVKSFFDAARMRWNDIHDIKIHGYEVEIYIENVGDIHKSSGIYSITNEEWIQEPDPSSVDIDISLARKKSDDIETQVNLIQHLAQKRKYKTVLRAIERLKEKIRRMRQAGLDSPKQEFSPENIAFKILRREEILQKLNDMKYDAYDNMLSIQ
jgi:hypothetical protein